MNETLAIPVLQEMPANPARFEQVWVVDWSIQGINDIGDLIECLKRIASRLSQMQASGVVLHDDIDGGAGLLVTDDPEVARRFGFGRVEGE